MATSMVSSYDIDCIDFACGCGIVAGGDAEQT